MKRFLNKKIIKDAIDVFMSFQTLNPGYPKLDYIQWMIAEAYFKSMPDTIDRDLSMAYEAISAYTKLMNDFPKSVYLKILKIDLRSVKTLFMEERCMSQIFTLRLKSLLPLHQDIRSFCLQMRPLKMKKEHTKLYCFTL